MLDWNDLRSFLAVARHGSTLAAGRMLRVSQTTVARRIAALEQSAGVTLFDRRQAGYALTPAGNALLPHAQAVEAAAATFDAAASAESRQLTGTVRLTTAEIYAVTVLAPVLRALHDAYPEITIDLDTSDVMRDLGSGSADVALRGCYKLEGAGLVGRRITDDPWTIYCSRAYAAAHGVPRSRADLHGHTIIGGGGERVWPIYAQWLSENGLDRFVTLRHSSAVGLLSAVRAGSGIAVLPSFVADRDPDLVRCLPPAGGHTVTLWLLTHERVRRAPHVRAVIDFVYEQLIRIAKAEPLPSAA